MILRQHLLLLRNAHVDVRQRSLKLPLLGATLEARARGCDLRGGGGRRRGARHRSRKLIPAGRARGRAGESDAIRALSQGGGGLKSNGIVQPIKAFLLQRADAALN